MIILKLNGGLGNQLFQIFAFISYALKYNLSFKILKYKSDIKSLEGGKRPTYWDTLFKKLEKFLINEIPEKYLVYNNKFTYIIRYLISHILTRKTYCLLVILLHINIFRIIFKSLKI